MNLKPLNTLNTLNKKSLCSALFSRHFASLVVYCLFSAFAVTASTVNFTFEDLTGNPITNTECVLTLVQPPYTDGPAIMSAGAMGGGHVTFTTDQNGNATLTLRPGLFSGRLMGSPATYFGLSVPSDNNTYAAAALLTNATPPWPTNYIPGAATLATNTGSSFLYLGTNGNYLTWYLVENTNAAASAITNTDGTVTVTGNNISVAATSNAIVAKIPAAGTTLNNLTGPASICSPDKTITINIAGTNIQISVAALSNAIYATFVNGQSGASTNQHLFAPITTNLTESATLTVAGSFSTDANQITSDGTGDLTVGSLTAGGSDITGSSIAYSETLSGPFNAPGVSFNSGQFIFTQGYNGNPTSFLVLGVPNSGAQETMDIQPANLSQRFTNALLVLTGNGNFARDIVDCEAGILAGIWWDGFTNIIATQWTANIWNRVIYANAAANSVQVTLPGKGTFGNTQEDSPAWTSFEGSVGGGGTNLAPKFNALWFDVYNNSPVATENAVTVCLADHAPFDNGQTNLTIPNLCSVRLRSDGTNIWVQRFGTNWPVPSANLTGPVPIANLPFTFSGTNTQYLNGAGTFSTPSGGSSATFNPSQFNSQGGSTNVPSGVTLTNVALNGASNNPASGITNAGVGFVGNGASLTNSSGFPILFSSSTSANVGGNLTGLNASSLSSGTVPAARMTGTYSINLNPFTVYGGACYFNGQGNPNGFNYAWNGTYDWFTGIATSGNSWQVTDTGGVYKNSQGGAPAVMIFPLSSSNVTIIGSLYVTNTTGSDCTSPFGQTNVYGPYTNSFVFLTNQLFAATNLVLFTNVPTSATTNGYSLDVNVRWICYSNAANCQYHQRQVIEFCNINGVCNSNGTTMVASGGKNANGVTITAGASASGIAVYLTGSNTTNMTAVAAEVRIQTL